MCRRGKGFTLIELLVVIAIIAILAAILFPLFASTKEKGRQTLCLNNMGQLGKGFRMYLDTWNRYPGSAPLQQNPKGQYVWLAPDTSITGSPYAHIYQKSALWPYILNTKIFVCPSDQWQMLQRGGGLVNKAIKAKREFGLSYSMSWFFPWLAESDVVKPARTCFLIDEGAGSKNSSGQWNAIVDGNFGPTIDWPGKPHIGGCNYGFCDGHAKWYYMKDFKQINWGVKGELHYDPPLKAIED